MSSRKNVISSGCGAAVAKSSNLPSSSICFADRMTAPQPTRASVPPTLMRRTPIAAMSATVKPAIRRHQQVDRFRRNRLHHRLDLLAGPDARRIKAIRPGVGIGLEPLDRLIEIGAADAESIPPAGEHRRRPALSIAARAARIRATAVSSHTADWPCRRWSPRWRDRRRQSRHSARHCSQRHRGRAQSRPRNPRSPEYRWHHKAHANVRASPQGRQHCRAAPASARIPRWSRRSAFEADALCR